MNLTDKLKKWLSSLPGVIDTRPRKGRKYGPKMNFTVQNQY
jgi:hypothetical protein